MSYPHTHPSGLPAHWVVQIARVYPVPWELQFEGYDVVVQVPAEERISQARVVRYHTGHAYTCLGCHEGQEGRAFNVCEHIEVVYAFRDTLYPAPDPHTPDYFYTYSY